MKSKRHCKILLQAMRKAGAVQTKPLGKGQNFGYTLRDVSERAKVHAIGGPVPVQPSGASV